MAFATAEDIATRLGEESLSATEKGSAELLIELATAVIAEAVDQDDAWAEELAPVPTIVKALTIELVCRAMASPQGLASATETLGAYSRSETYRKDLSSALMLTELEERMLRRAIVGQLSGSVRIESHIDDIYDALIGS